ncbi:MAG: tetratricopeptide repeat protein, partial [Bacteroidia bacterium]|nr:tetratricopeptide repeat protein [Bacteroidia bacterium]
LFEFLLVLLDPFIENLTNSEPGYKLMVNAVLAAMIFPLHSLAETRLKRRLFKKKSEAGSQKSEVGKTLLFLIGLMFVGGLNLGFDNPQDSLIQNLKLKIQNSKEDTTRIKTLLKIGRHFAYTKPDTTLNHYQKALSLATAINHKKLIARCNNSMGRIYMRKSDYPQALHYYNEALSINEQLKDKKAMAGNYNNIGNIYTNQSSYPLALTYYFKSLKIEEEQSNKQGMAASYNNIGIIYDNQSTYPLALTYYFKALKIKEEQGNKQGMASSYNNIGTLYTTLYEQGDSPPAGGVGEWAAENPIKLLDSAMYYQQKALAINKELSDEFGMTFELSGIASILRIKGKYSQAIGYYQQCAQLADSIGALQKESEAHSGLSTCYEKLNNHKLALDHYKQYSTLKDSIFNEEKSKDLGKLEAKHEFEMAELQKKQQEEEWTKVEAARINRRNDLQHSAILIGIFILFGSLFLLGKLSIPNWLIELSVFIPFLILFEFLLVLLDPSIESWAGSEPAFKLLFNAGLAGMMFPLHQFFEGKLKKRIVNAQMQKLKKRMEQYKRDVEEL